MRSWLILLGLCITCTYSLGQDDELLCFNAGCFEPDPAPETIVLKESVTVEPRENLLLPETPENLEERDIDNKPDAFTGTGAQRSKFFEILEENDPFHNKRFLYVPSRDMDWSNYAELESTRPNIILKYFNKPDEQLVFNFEESD
jgi:hypothetical protein